jgi:hypothetical protein
MCEGNGWYRSGNGFPMYYEKMSKFLDNLGESSSKNQSDIEQWDKYLGEYKQFMDQMKEKVIIMRK